MSFISWLLGRRSSPAPGRVPRPLPAAPRLELPAPMRLPGGPLRFIALDVETANSSAASICQIGLAFVHRDGRIESSSSYVDSGHRFSAFNTQLHGIGPDQVRGAPSFPLLFRHIAPLLSEHLIIQHSNFDRQAIHAACGEHGLDLPGWTWADSVRIARRAWPEFKGNGGHGLGHLKTALGLDFKHHDAGEDARAAAMVVLKAETRTGLHLDVLTSNAPVRRSSATDPAKPAKSAKPTRAASVATVPAPHLGKLVELVTLLSETDVLSPAEINRLRKEKLAWVQAQPLGWKDPDDETPWLQLSEEDREAAANDLAVHVDNLLVQCRGYFRSGNIPAPHSAMRIAIILTRAKLSDQERSFLEAWCRHFQRAESGRTYGILAKRAEKRGIAMPRTRP